MKKSTFFTTITFAFVILLSTNINAQKFAGLDKSPLDIAYYKTDRNSPPMVKVIYSRPQLKGRDLSKLAPNGKVWRTGANEATEITFFQDTKFGDETVEAGTYSLFTIPGETEWTIILSKDLDVWGAYNYNESKDALRIKAPVSSGDSVEEFSIAFDSGNMYLAWDTVRVSIPVSK
ncbi:Protein of unknown function [Flaviramulus basaltis]|uniref:DUF2911 domain-containing protein n=1 Tax=Flaviramulus basaltis TaxID=369401 RepID=A0A1K2I9W5_9FLAO|nr:DUF2911 domain-containing protein [Flaviramulus basaltis]SFZ89205.1 Protein of unknown function [Flaviramulus basaltis]